MIDEDVHTVGAKSGHEVGGARGGAGGIHHVDAIVHRVGLPQEQHSVAGLQGDAINDRGGCVRRCQVGIDLRHHSHRGLECEPKDGRIHVLLVGSVRRGRGEGDVGDTDGGRCVARPEGHLLVACEDHGGTFESGCEVLEGGDGCVIDL